MKHRLTIYLAALMFLLGSLMPARGMSIGPSATAPGDRFAANQTPLFTRSNPAKIQVEESPPNPKNRVREIFSSTVNLHLADELPSQQLQWKIRLALAETASGIPVFLNADPIGFSGGSNWYAYADGNPISLSDPFGLCASRNSCTGGYGSGEGYRSTMPDWLRRSIGSAHAEAGRMWNDINGGALGPNPQMLFAGGGQAFSNLLGRTSAVLNSSDDVAYAAKGIATPHGLALQADTAAARTALGEVQSGATVYRQGSFGVQNTADAQFWSLQNPAGAQGFANKMGMPGGSGSPDWIMGGTISRGSPVITRPAPGIGTNVGGAMEAVVPKNGVSNLWFHMPD